MRPDKAGVGHLALLRHLAYAHLVGTGHRGPVPVSLDFFESTSELAHAVESTASSTSASVSLPFSLVAVEPSGERLTLAQCTAQIVAMTPKRRQDREVYAMLAGPEAGPQRPLGDRHLAPSFVELLLAAVLSRLAYLTRPARSVTPGEPLLFQILAPSPKDLANIAAFRRLGAVVLKDSEDYVRFRPDRVRNALAVAMQYWRLHHGEVHDDLTDDSRNDTIVKEAHGERNALKDLLDRLLPKELTRQAVKRLLEVSTPVWLRLSPGRGGGGGGTFGPRGRHPPITLPGQHQGDSEFRRPFRLEYNWDSGPDDKPTGIRYRLAMREPAQRATERGKEIKEIASVYVNVQTSGLRCERLVVGTVKVTEAHANTSDSWAIGQGELLFIHAMVEAIRKCKPAAVVARQSAQSAALFAEYDIGQATTGEIARNLSHRIFLWQQKYNALPAGHHWT